MADNLAGAGRELDVSLPTILGYFNTLRETTGVMRSCATPYPLKAHTGTTVNILNYGKFQAYSLQEGVDMNQAQALADALTSVTPAEIGVQVLLPKTTLRRVADPQLESRVAKMMHDAYDAKEDGDGCDQLVNFTPRLGGAATCIGVGHIYAGASRLAIGNTRRQDSAGTRPEPAPKPWWGVLQPQHSLVIQGKLIPLGDDPDGGTGYGAATGAHAGDDVVPGGTPFTAEMMRGGPGFMGTLAGINFKQDAYINVDSSDDASSAVFSQEGLIWCEEWAPDIEEESDASRRIKEINMVGSSGWTVYRPASYGVELLFDATLPTS